MVAGLGEDHRGHEGREKDDLRKHFLVNSRSKVAIFAVLLVVVAARPSSPYAPPPSYPDTPAKYEFNYAVKDDYSGNDFSHGEARNGYDTSGSYQVLLPDGRVQTVEYTVSKDGGFLANVVAKGVKAYA